MSRASSESSQSSGSHGSTPYVGRPVTEREHVDPGLQQRDVAAELVHQEAADQSLVGGVQQRDGAEHRREHSPAIDVPDHDHRRLDVLCEPHVHVVGPAQVDLRRTARALTDHHVVPGREVVVRGEGRLGQLGPLGQEPAGRQLTPGLPHQDDVTAAIAARLEQDRVHRGLRLGAGRDGLDPLRPADLGAVGTDHRVVRHVLRLVRRHPDTLPGQPPAEPGHHGRLPRVGRRTGDQQ